MTNQNSEIAAEALGVVAPMCWILIEELAKHDPRLAAEASDYLQSWGIARL